MKNMSWLSLLVSSFFLALFMVAGSFNLFEGDYLSALGFFMLSIANAPALMRNWLDPATRPGATIFTNSTAIVGLLLVVLGWFMGI